MSAPILVTGAAGFIGRQVVSGLLARGYAVRAFDLHLPTPAPGVDARVGSVEDPVALRSAIDGAAAVIHLAYRIDIDGIDPLATVRTNLSGTANLFEMALAAGVGRVVWASSVMTYASPALQRSVCVSEDGIQAPDTFYGAGKLFLEKAAASYRQHGLETVAMRMTTVFGPGRDRGGAAPFAVELFSRPSRGEPVHISDGDRRLNFIYGPDAASACIAAAIARGSLAPAYNIGGFTARVREVAGMVRRYLPGAQIEVLPGGVNPWPEEISTLSAQRDFSWEPRFDLQTAVADYLSFLAGDNEGTVSSKHVEK